jgi:hypothetical protein
MDNFKQKTFMITTQAIIDFMKTKPENGTETF